MFSKNLPDDAILFNYLWMIISKYLNLDVNYDYDNHSKVLQPGWWLWLCFNLDGRALQPRNRSGRHRSGLLSTCSTWGWRLLLRERLTFEKKYWIDPKVDAYHCENISSSRKVKFKMGTSWQPQSRRWGSNGSQNDPPVKMLFSKFWSDVKKKKINLLNFSRHAMPCHGYVSLNKME